MGALILASASPRRRELLKGLAESFETVVSGAPELDELSCHWSEVALRNAVAKARSVASARPDCLVLGADTVIELDGRILGKPGSLAEAKAMLLAMSGRSHSVSTGVCLACEGRGVLCQFVDVSSVRFKALTDSDVEEYLRLVHVLDKAGAYAIQEFGEMIIESVEGDRDNVIGLPAKRVAEALAACGFN